MNKTLLSTPLGQERTPRADKMARLGRTHLAPLCLVGPRDHLGNVLSHRERGPPRGMERNPIEPKLDRVGGTPGELDSECVWRLMNMIMSGMNMIIGYSVMIG